MAALGLRFQSVDATHTGPSREAADVPSDAKSDLLGDLLGILTGAESEYCVWRAPPNNASCQWDYTQPAPV
jgi:hypothetical protein